MRPQFISEEDFKVFETRIKDGKQITKRVRSGVGSNHKGRKLPSALDLPHARPSTVEGTRATSSPYKSKWEAAYANKLELEKRAGLIKWWRYEPFSLWLPGKVRYKPDFLVHYHPTTLVETSPMLEVIEVKGWSKNRRDGVTRLKIAAALFPCFTWRLVQWNGSGFVGEYIT